MTGAAGVDVLSDEVAAVGDVGGCCGSDCGLDEWCEGIDACDAAAAGAGDGDGGCAFAAAHVDEVMGFVYTCGLEPAGDAFGRGAEGIEMGEEFGQQWQCGSGHIERSGDPGEELLRWLGSNRRVWHG